jgi:hypothetical protein
LLWKEQKIPNEAEITVSLEFIDKESFDCNVNTIEHLGEAEVSLTMLSYGFIHWVGHLG